MWSFPAFLNCFFFVLRALATILFLADFAFLSLNLSKSFRPFLRDLMAILLAHVELSQVDWTFSASISLRTTLVEALKAKLTLRGDSCSFLMGKACLTTPEVGPSRRTRFWSMTLTMAAILPESGPSPRTATRPISTNLLNGISLVEVNQAILAW